MNCDKFKFELHQNCEIGALWKLSGGKAESENWAVEAFLEAKDNNSVCLVQDF